MEDKTPLSTNASSTSAAAADTLRELQARAQAALTAQRDRMGQLESQLIEQLDTLSETLAEQIGERSDESEHAQHTGAELQRLRQEFNEAQAAWNDERARLTAEATDCDEQFEARQTDLDAQAAELEARDARLDALAAELDARAAALDKQHDELVARQKTLDERHTGLNTQQRENGTRQQELGNREKQLAAAEEQLEKDRAAMAKREASWQEQRAALERDRDGLMEQLSALNGERQQSQDDSSQRVTALKQEMAELQQELARQESAWAEERTALVNERVELETNRNELAAALEANEAVASGSQEELAQKFDLALEDVQRLRGRVAELEQELASRPGADQKQSVELVHLRSERDALAERVAELEQQPAAAGDADAAQDLVDLQRRFELAVEDVRDLKKQNAELESQIADAKSRGSTVVAPAASSGSWEALKQQMLANLEGEGDSGDDERQEERAKIEDTIRITDEVVASKDQEIAALKSELLDSDNEAEDEAIRELVDSDDIIRQHRERIANTEAEMNEKLRTAELQLSMERAKIAREQVELADLRAELDALRAAGDYGHGGGGGDAHAPKRRWLSKLGLTGDDEGK